MAAAIWLSRAALLLLACTVPVRAWECPPPAAQGHVTPAELYGAEVATVALRPDRQIPGWGEADVTVRVQTVVRGPSLPTVRQIVAPMYAGGTAHNLRPGSRYVFFVHEGGVIPLCSGTRPLPVDATEAETLLQHLRTYGQPTPADRPLTAR